MKRVLAALALSGGLLAVPGAAQADPVDVSAQKCPPGYYGVWTTVGYQQPDGSWTEKQVIACQYIG